MTAQDLGILDIQVNQVNDTLTHEVLYNQYLALFKGIGQLEGVKVKRHNHRLISTSCGTKGKANSLSSTQKGGTRAK